MMPDSSRSRWINRLCRAYAAVLYAYPSGFRIRFGREMHQVFRERCRAAARDKELFVFVLRAFWDWLGASAREWIAAMRNPEVHVMQPLVAGWWLLALCGIADAMCGAMHLLMLNVFLSISAYRAAPVGIEQGVWYIGVFGLIAGTCAIAAGAWNFRRGNAWLLSLHGLALGAFGLIGVSPLVKGPLGFRPVSLLFVLMAVSAGAFAFGSARTLRSESLERCFLIVCGAAWFVFAFSFVAVGFGWIRLRLWYSYWIWMSSYFALCSAFMLYLALRVRNRRAVAC
jgi:hypothetical protein